MRRRLKSAAVPAGGRVRCHEQALRVDAATDRGEPGVARRAGTPCGCRCCRRASEGSASGRPGLDRGQEPRCVVALLRPVGRFGLQPDAECQEGAIERGQDAAVRVGPGQRAAELAQLGHVRRVPERGPAASMTAAIAASGKLRHQRAARVRRRGSLRLEVQPDQGRRPGPGRSCRSPGRVRAVAPVRRRRRRRRRARRRR